MVNNTEKEVELEAPPTHSEAHTSTTEPINASGHVQELDRNFSFLSVCSVGICTGNAWAALGGTIVVSLYNGGPPGVLYELLAVSVFYWIIAACIAELASSIPSSAGVYHFATVTAGPRYGKVVGWYAGWWNVFAWIFGTASISSILANQVISMWGLFHEEFVAKRWHVFITYQIITWMGCLCVMYANRALPTINQLGLFFILSGVVITIVVLAILPSTIGTGHASSSFVWKEWQNQAGYESDGLVFVLGMLNGAFAVGTPDCVTHIAEEVPNPRINIPKAIAAQMVTGLVTAFCYIVAVLYSISDLEAVLAMPYTFPLAEVYRQGTSSRGGSLGLLLVIFLPTCCTGIGTFITSGRMLWTLARDNATPFSQSIGRISPSKGNPFIATFVCGLVNSLLGCIYVGSDTAFNAFVGSFVILTTLSYLSAILPNLINRRAHVVPGPFWMPAIVAYPLQAIACGYITVFIVLYCFPFALPVSAANMNYASLITGGLSIFITAWYFWKRKTGYQGAQVLTADTCHLPIVQGHVPGNVI